MCPKYRNIFLALIYSAKMMWVLVLIVVIVLIFYLRKEGLESKESKDTKDSDSKDSTSKDSTSKDSESKDSVSKDSDTKSSDSKSTTVVIVEGGNRYPLRTTDPFYAMTDPYWATYNYRVGPYPHRGQYIPRHRRIW